MLDLEIVVARKGGEKTEGGLSKCGGEDGDVVEILHAEGDEDDFVLDDDTEPIPLDLVSPTTTYNTHGGHI
jgi:hypothetical protein